MIDLHTHSTFSDGTMKPDQLLKYAEKRDVEVLALTDHDTVDGLDSFLEGDSPVERVCGVEISLAYEPGEFHMVGLFIDHKNPVLTAALNRLKDNRRERNEKLIELVGGLVGRQLSEKDITTENDGEIGRPHIAKFLVKNGAAKDMNDAFDRYLGKGGSLYVPKDRLDFHQASEIIHEAGGITVLAHPLTLEVEERYTGGFLKYLKGLGLDAVEVWCSETPEEKYEFFLNIAREHDLGVTGGSDFHGDNSLGIGLGTGRGDLNIPYSVFQDLKDKFGK